MRQQFLVQRIKNYWHTAFLFIGMLAIMLLLGYSLFGVEGLIWSGLLGAFGLYMSTQIPAKAIMRMQGGRALRYYEAPELSRVTEQLAKRAGLEEVPQLYYLPSNMMNAFTTGGKQDAAIAISRGLLEQLNFRELTGVIAHEMAHIKNNDIKLKGLVNIIARLTNMFSFIGKILFLVNLPLIMAGTYNFPWIAILLLIAAPYLVTIMNMAISRTREFDADLEAAKLTGDPIGLANGLQKINYLTRRGKTWLSPIQKVSIPKILRTHPTTTQRVNRLRELAPHYNPIFEQGGRQWITLYDRPRHIIVQ
ncbi:MAG: zinc metalloprotease HtpX [Saprospiraceae bacterium]|nr:zinc metalloprotease HtpX [Saprospiraceae bacterium]